MKKIVLFDMDGTLTPPRKKVSNDVIKSLKNLSNYFDIGVVTGSDFEYVNDQLSNLFLSIDYNKIHLFPCNGTKHYSNNKNGFLLSSSVNMIDHIGKKDYQLLLQTIISYQLIITLKYDLPYTGTFFQYRDSMLNWCPIGRSASENERNKWIEEDTNLGIRKKYLNDLNKVINLKNIPVSAALGGSTSIDIFPKGWDKTYVLNHLSEYKEILFVGDRCEKEENDYEIYTLLKDGNDTQSFKTSSPLETIDIIEKIIQGASVKPE